jgi:hypothetical protein
MIQKNEIISFNLKIDIDLVALTLGKKENR